MENQHTFANPDIEPSEDGLVQVMQAAAVEAKQKFNQAHDQMMVDILANAKQLSGRG